MSSHHLCFVLTLSMSLSLWGDVNSTSGNIIFDVSNNGTTEMMLNRTGLGIGISNPSANLTVSGNGVVSDKIAVGSSTAPSSNLTLTGTMGFSLQQVSANTTLGAYSTTLVSGASDNVVLTLPYAGNVNGRTHWIKNNMDSNKVWVKGGGNLIDTSDSLELKPSGGVSPSVRVLSNGSKWYITSAYGNVLNTVAADNLVGWWKLDDTSGNTALDSSGYNNHGTGNNTFTFSNNTGGGKIGNAIYFNNSLSSYIMVPDANQLDINKFTLSYWIKRDTVGAFTPVLSKFNDYGDQVFYAHMDADNSFNMGFNDSTNSTENWRGTNSTTLVSSGNWFHACFTYDGSQRTFYINGQQEDQTAGSYTIPASSGNFYIGARQHNGSGLPNGYVKSCWLDDIRIYNRALTGQEVSVLYQD